MTQEVELDTSSPKKATIEKQYNVYVLWSQPDMPWNEICAKVIEVFGLPGGRFTCRTTTHFIVFNFKSEKDFVLGEILLSEYMTK